MKYLEEKTSPPAKKVFVILFIISLSIMMWNYVSLYDQSIDWEVITTANVVEFPALVVEGGLLDHEVTGEKYRLSERYAGTPIKRSLIEDQLYLAIIWTALCMLLATSTYFHRYLFFAVIAAFALMINRLNFFEVGLFGINSKMVMLIPFLSLTGPLVYFHEFNRKPTLLLRFLILIGISSILCFGISNDLNFTDHLIAHSIFPLAICFLIFLLFISEEIVFGFLYVVTSSKGRSNHIHFIVLSLIYLGNLTLYYLNKSGLYPNAFSFFDPYLLFAISCFVACWSLNFKTSFDHYIPQHFLVITFACLGILCTTFLSLSLNRGVDAIHETFHYFILYFHIGFGLFFFFYLISNFLDPLVQGFQIWKIAYKERNFPYVTAKLGGLVCIAAFYFLSGQESYNLLTSGYYNYLGNLEENRGNELLAKEYWIQATYLGYNTHYPNYRLGWIEWDRNKDLQAKSRFYSAAQRHPSPYAWANYGNLEVDRNGTKVQAVYEEALRKVSSPEMENNLGLIHLAKNDPATALNYFESGTSSDKWNQALKVNEWNVYAIQDSLTSYWQDDYKDGNYGVKSNVLAVLDSGLLPFTYNSIKEVVPIHRQAYLLNASYLLYHDSIKSLLNKEISNTNLAATNNLLSKALAIHLYKKGEVNAAFRMLDNLQANAAKYSKGEYLDILGKLALDQSAFSIALEYFNEAISDRYEASRISRLEAYAALGNSKSFESELLKIVKRDPSLTAYANDLIDRFNSYNPKIKEYESYELNAMSDTSLFLLAKKNAFNEALVLEVVNELSQREAEGGYDILIESIEINRYDPSLLQQYILTALDWGLVSYTIPVLDRLNAVMSPADYDAFLAIYEAKKIEVSQNAWQ